MSQVKIIEIKANTKQAQKEFEDFGDVIQEQKDITIEFEKELRDLESTLSSTSKGNLAKQKVLKGRITGLKDAIKDQKLAVKDLNNQKKKQVEVDSLTLDGATRNYGAVQLLDQVTGGYASQVRSAVDASRLFNKSLTGMRAALIASGIGILVVALSAIVLYWDEIVELIEDSNGKLQKNIDLSIKAQETTQLRIDILDKQIALNEKLGKGNELLQKQRIALVKQLRAQNAEEIAGLELQAEKLKTSTLELSTREKILRAIMNANVAGSGDAYLAEQQLEASQQYLDIQALILKAKGEQIDLDTKLFDLENPETDGGADAKKEKVSTVGGGLTTAQLTELETNAEFETAKTLILADGAQQRELISQYEADAKKAINESYIDHAVNGIGVLASAFEKNKGLQKALLVAESLAGIAKIVINTQAANAAATLKYSLLPGGQALAAAEIISNKVGAGIGIAANIVATTKALGALGGGGVRGGSGGNVGGGRTPSAPSFNVVGNSGASQIAQTINQDQQPVEAYVVAGNVSSAQELNRNIVETASIG